MSCCTGNQGKSCPTRMNDGRAFTDYRPKCIINNALMNNLTQQNIIGSSYESRMFLQKNADVLIDKYKKDAETNLFCGNCQRPQTDVDTMYPEQYIVKCDQVSCQRQLVNPNGLGDGRNYG